MRLITNTSLNQKESQMAEKQTMTLEEALQVILAADGENPLRQMLEWMVQQALELEMNGHLGADRYERSD